MTNPHPKQPGFHNRVKSATNRLLKYGKHWNGDNYSKLYCRAMDNCFENSDGDAVVWQLMHKAQSDSRLLQAIKDFCGTDECFAAWERVYRGEGKQMMLL
jgi:hypothetical protein